MIDIFSNTLIIIGISFDLFGCVGLIRMPDIYNRLQASAKCVTLGTCGILLGVFVKFGFSAAGVKALLCIIFIILTAPVSAHALARGAHRSGVKLWEKSVCDKYKDSVQ
ncbi:MAG: monovalent cation/H(+) antiporter subunit G [Candidatus Omnitrophota bacterium]